MAGVVSVGGICVCSGVMMLPDYSGGSQGGRLHFPRVGAGFLFGVIYRLARDELGVWLLLKHLLKPIQQLFARAVSVEDVA